MNKKAENNSHPIDPKALKDLGLKCRKQLKQIKCIR